MSEIRKKHAGLRFFIREAGSSAVAAAVLSGELDLGIVTLPITLAGGMNCFMPLVADQLCLIVPPKQALAGKRAFRSGELAGADVVAFEAGSAVRDVIDRAAADAGAEPQHRDGTCSIESIKQMVRAGIGVGFVSRFALGMEEGLTCRDSGLSRQMAIVRRRDRDLSPAAGVSRRIAAVVVLCFGAGVTVGLSADGAGAQPPYGVCWTDHAMAFV